MRCELHSREEDTLRGSLGRESMWLWVAGVYEVTNCCEEGMAKQRARDAEKWLAKA